MAAIRILEDEEAIRALVPEAARLAEAAGTDLAFHHLPIPLLWWQHFRSMDGSDFAARRGRTFLGTKSVLEKLVVAVAEEGGLRALAPLAIQRVHLKGNRPPVRLLTFCADSVILFYQDMLIHPSDRPALAPALLHALADYAAENGLALFLGYIREDSGNLPFFEAAVAERVRSGWWGGITESRFRGGVYPWTIHKLGRALGQLREALPGDPAEQAALAALEAKLPSAGPALLGFQATRLAYEAEVDRLMARHGEAAETRPAVEAMRAAIAGDIIRYPYLPLPAQGTDYLGTLSSSKRYYFRRYGKKFAELGGDFECVAPEALTADDVEEYLTLHQQRWGSDSVAVNALTLPFHRDIALEGGRAGLFRLFFARHAGKRVAAHACFDIRGRREYFFSGRDPASEELRAGKLLIMHTVEDAVKRGFPTYDFGYGGDDYKAEFTSSFKRVKNLFLAAPGTTLDLEALFPRFEHMVLPHL
jgi:hypothetical protein